MGFNYLHRFDISSQSINIRVLVISGANHTMVILNVEQEKNKMKQNSQP